MRKIIGLMALVLIFCFITFSSFAKPVEIDGVTLSDPTAVTLNEVSSWTSNSVGVSDELMKAFLNKESKLLGNIGDALSVMGIGKQVYEDDDWGALTGATLFVVKKIFSKTFPETAGKANVVLVAIDAYITALKIVHQYVWIPKLTDKTYEIYKDQRTVESPQKAFEYVDVQGDYIRPVWADAEERIRSEKYNMKEKDLTPKFRARIKEDAKQFLISVLERRYQKERMPEMMKVAADKAKEKRKKHVEKLKDKLEMPVRGVVVDAETSKPISGAKIGVKGRRYAVRTKSDGSFYIPVPYRLVEGQPFHIYAVKGKEYAGKYSRKISWKETKVPRIRFGLESRVATASADEDELSKLRDEHCEIVGKGGLLTKEACLTQVMASERPACERDGLSEKECKKSLIKLYKGLKELSKKMIDFKDWQKTQ